MRPYFFRRPAVTKDRQNPRAARFRNAAKKAASRAPRAGFFSRVLEAIRPRNLTEAHQAAIYAAQNKRARRRARNLRWWANDRAWEFYGRAR